ncbi:MAG: hypothetical protein Q9226_008337, partial [Calogaya cf. arnoldii]
MDDIDDFITRRFAFLHARLLLDRYQEFEQELGKLDKVDDYFHPSYGRISKFRLTNIQNAQPRESIDFIKHRRLLLSDINEKLFEYNSMLVQMHTLPQYTTSGNPRQRYISVGQYLNHGPDIHLDRSGIRGNAWVKYQLAVKDFLRDQTSAFLNRPLDQEWLEETHQKANTSSKPWTTFKAGWKSGTDLPMRLAVASMIRFCVYILFWTGHITAALGFALVANIPKTGGNPIGAL